MKQIGSMHKLYSVLSRIEESYREVAVFLCLYGYSERPDIVTPDTGLIRTDVSVKFDAATARNILRMVCEEQKEKGHPEIAVKAMELCTRLSALEEETMGKNTQ